MNKEEPEIIIRDVTEGFKEVFDKHNNPDPDEEEKKRIDDMRKARVKQKKRDLGL